MIIIYGYLKRENDKIFKFHMSNFFFLKNKYFLVTLFRVGYCIPSLPYGS